MRRILSASLIAVLAAVPLARAAPLRAADGQELLRLASRLSGLGVRRAVPVTPEEPARFRRHRLALHDRLYPPRAQAIDGRLYAALGVAASPADLRPALVAGQRGDALYDRATRKVHVRARAGTTRERLAAFVHALQDQHGALRRRDALVGDRDAARAAEAMLEGQALLVARLPRPRTPSATSAPLSRLVEFELAFPETIGLRLAVTLRNLGRDAAVLSAVRRFPATTEQVFHVDKFFEREPALPVSLPAAAAGWTRSGQATFGELDVRALLAAARVAGRDRVGSGWGGGRSGLYRDGSVEAAVLALRWDSERDADEWAAAVGNYVDAVLDGAVPAPGPCAASACWQAVGRAAAFARDGARTVFVVAPDAGRASELAAALTPP